MTSGVLSSHRERYPWRKSGGPPQEAWGSQVMRGLSALWQLLAWFQWPAKPRGLQESPYFDFPGGINLLLLCYYSQKVPNLQGDFNLSPSVSLSPSLSVSFSQLPHRTNRPRIPCHRSASVSVQVGLPLSAPPPSLNRSGCLPSPTSWSPPSILLGFTVPKYL